MFIWGDIKWLGVLSVLWMVSFGLISLPVMVPIFLAFFLFFYTDGAMQSPWTFFTTCLGITIAQGITAVWGGTSVFTVGAGVGGIGQSFLALNKLLGGWLCARPRGVLSDWGIGYVFKWWRVGVVNRRMSFILGSSCWIRDFSKFSCYQIVYCYWYAYGCRLYHGHLGGGSCYCGDGTSLGKIHWSSWHWGSIYGLGNYPHSIPLFGGHPGSSLLLFRHLGSWDCCGHGVVILGRDTGAWLWLGLGLGPGFGSKHTLLF